MSESDSTASETDGARVPDTADREVNAVRAALRVRNFRNMWLSSFGSTIGTWMQNVILAAFVYSVTRSPVLVSLIGFANLVPQLLLSPLGGVIADMFDRKKLIYWFSVEQMLGSLAIAWIVRTEDFSRPALLVAVFAVGAGAALQGPVFLAVTPSLVPARILAGAISLNSVSMNVSRVIGPAIGSALYVFVGASWVFVLNAATYLIIMIGITWVDVPTFQRRMGEGKLERLFGGFGFVRRDPVVRRAVISVFLFSVFCMPFVVLFPVLASEQMGVNTKSTTYGLLYGVFGLGAVVGALSIGTFLSGHRIEKVVRVSFAGFGAFLALFAALRSAIPAFPVGFVLGVFYFAAVTSLATIFQSRLNHEIRGRVSAVWMMAFGGTVPVSGLLAGWIVELTSIYTVVTFGALFALFLAWFADLRVDDPHGIEDLLTVEEVPRPDARVPRSDSP